MICPRLATLALNETTFPGDVFVQVQSCVPLPGVLWENRHLQSVEAFRCRLCIQCHDIRPMLPGNRKRDIFLPCLPSF